MSNKNINPDAPLYSFKLPRWTYDGYITEIDNFRKGITGIASEPGWFYFKLIFHFDEPYGLLGNIVYTLNDTELKSDNTARKYLTDRQQRFKYDNLSSRLIALEKFVKYLSYINSSTPWFFDKISGLNEIVPQLNDFSKEKKIEISCMPDAVDMRLTSLFHLYQYACFDEINMKEIIPENLRKFNMTVVLFHMPIKYINTPLIINNEKIESSPLIGNGNDSNTIGNAMSFKMFTLHGCEFDLNSMGSIVPGTLDNAQPFNLAQNNIIIKYDRAYTHLMNQWDQFLVGSDGFYYDKAHNINWKVDSDIMKRLNFLLKCADEANAPALRYADALLSKAAFYTTQEHTLMGNIYQLDTFALKVNESQMRNQPCVSLSNMYNIYPIDLKLKALTRHIPRGVVFSYGSNRYTGEGLSQLPDAEILPSMFSDGGFKEVFELSNEAYRMYYISDFEKLLLDYTDWRQVYVSQYYIPPFQTSIDNIVENYKNAWQYIKGDWYKATKANIKSQYDQLTGMWKL